MKSARTLGAVALVIAVLAAGVVVCPCAEHPSDRDHGCCAQGPTLRSATSVCCAGSAAFGVAPSVESAAALLLPSAVAFPSAAAQAPHDSARSLASPFSVSPPTVLRI